MESAQSSPRTPKLLRVSGSSSKNPSRSTTPISSRNPSPSGTLRKAATPSVHDAIAFGEFSKVREHVQKGGDINARAGKEQSTMLHIAALFNRDEITKYLLDSGALVNTKDSEGSTPLQVAAFHGSLSCVKLLVTGGAKISTKDKEGSTPLHKASYQGHIKVVQYLIRNTKDKAKYINKTDDYGTTALHHASLKGDLETLRYLIQKGGNIHAEDKEGSSLLHKSILSNQLDCCRFLIESGSQVNCKDKQGSTPLHLSCELGYKDMCSLLISKGSQLNTEDNTFQTPLHNAAFHGHFDVITLLLEMGANINSKQISPLHHAAFGGHDKCVSLLIEKGANVKSRDNEGSTPLHKAAFNGHTATIKILISKGADVNAKDAEGSTPSHLAAFSGFHESLKALLDNGADPRVTDNDDCTSLHSAASNGHLESVKILLEAKSDPNAEDNTGSTPLHYAVRKGNKTCASFLIKNGGNVAAANDQLITALHYAIKYPPCVSLLLKNGAKVDAKDINDRTPLFYAVRAGIEESVRILIFRGADLEVKDKKGNNPTMISKILTKSVLKQIANEKTQNEQAAANKEYKIAVKNFNVKPKAGIEYLIENKVLPDDPTSIGKFLHTAEGLDKTQIGSYLGENDKFALQVLNAFVNYMDFRQFEVDHALRYFLSKFRLPGEAQKIDRIMEIFAGKFCSDNPGVFTNQDAAYLLSFSIIMLNTDAHNPNIKKENKMTKEQFIRNNRGINSGADLPIELLEKIYHRIVTDEIKMDSEGTFHSNAEMKGYLVKQGGRIKTWKRRWFVLSDNCIYYFKSHDDKEPIGIVPLENLAVRKTQRKFTFEIYHPDLTEDLKACKFDSSGAVVQGHHDSYLIACANEAELEQWMKAIETNIFKNPFLELIKKKLAIQRARSPIKVNRLTLSQTIDIRVNFKEISELAALCSSLVLESRDSLMSKYGSNTIIENYGKRNVYMFILNNDSKTQYIVLSSTRWASLKLMRKDLQFWASDEEKRHPVSYYKMQEAVEGIYSMVRQHLKKEYKTVITGYSHFSCVCADLALNLEQKGYQVKPIVTFGQPKVETEASKTNGGIRVLDPRDPIISLFPGYVSNAQEVLLLYGKYYTSTESKTETSEVEKLEEVAPYHLMNNYVKRIALKVRESVLISYDERNKYKDDPQTSE